jgi:hypothetical protein
MLADGAVIERLFVFLNKASNFRAALSLSSITSVESVPPFSGGCAMPFSGGFIKTPHCAFPSRLFGKLRHVSVN